MVQSLSRVPLFVTSWTAAGLASQSFTAFWTLLTFTSIESVMLSDHPLPSSSPPTFSLSKHQGLFQWVNSSHQWPKYCSFSLSLNSSSEYSGLISFGLTGLISLQSKGLSRVFSNTTVWKYQSFVNKVMSLIFSTVSRIVIAFLPRSKCLLISWQ